MLIKTKAIVFHSLKFGDAQLIVDLFTEACGRVSFIQQISKNPKAKIKKQFFQSLTILEIEFDFRQNAKLQRLKNARIETPFSNIPFDPYKLTILLFLADFLYYSTRSEQQNEPLFRYIEASIKWLDASQGNIANFHLVFMMRLSKFIGFFPNLDNHDHNIYFDLRNACFTASAPLHPDFLHPEEAARIHTLTRMNYESMHLFKMTREQRNRCAEIILSYYRFHIPNFPELKSFHILKELFST
ncbi:DNA repair protein RecO [Hoylesella oralis ATCC 33269]|uniref:DNA repair protein RecO n=1 Tax=Hoylesella oralis ATCC 33269 TaxID=873533 RepID=E7RNA9_9BACT|nr:DNA repair protein RecO [Hoylesella oralis]EFZ38240.1 DNA repair protein RecO [Hoylesella oralis ATCC 33269]EPH16594.1 DNA repair protein RecO [Hoylesella oralis HGA0225]SHF35296.1 DNA replication and repair protein RecO [Hoylesella oralis]